MNVKKAIAWALIALLLCAASGCAAHSSILAPEETIVVDNQMGAVALSARPLTRPDGKPFRIGVIDIDPYPLSGEIIYHLIDALRQAGWIVLNEFPFEPENADVQQMIDYLARRDIGPYMKFVADCNYYLAYDGEKAVKESLDEHVYVLEDIDMLWALGTWPANVAQAYTDRVPVVCYPLSAAKEAGIVRDYDYSGVKNIWAHTDPERYIRQMKVFHEVFPFTHIGVVYYDKSIAAIDDYEISGAQLGVKVDARPIDPLPPDPGESDILAYNAAFHSAVQDLRRAGIDAFVLTTDLIKDESEIDVFLDSMEGIPVFVQVGDYFVESGCLLTVDIFNVRELGLFVADSIGLILNGEKPEELWQIYVSTPYLVLNLDMLKKLEIQASFELLMSSEKIYYTRDVGNSR